LGRGCIFIAATIVRVPAMLLLIVMATVIAMVPMPVMHEDVHQWAGQYDQERQDAI